MKNPKTKKTIFTGLLTVCIGIVLTLSTFAWFYFSMSQNTSVYTDGVIDFEVLTYRYIHSSNNFLEVPPDPEAEKIEFGYSDENGGEVAPYFFLWDGEYTCGEIHQSIHKVVVTYDNAIKAYPSKLDLFGVFNSNFWCIGDDGRIIDIRFMKLSYFVPSEPEQSGYLETDNYVAFSSEDYTDENIIPLGTVRGGTSTSTPYTITFYLMLEIDLEALNADAYKLKDDFGLLNAKFDINAALFLRTAPVNTLPQD